MDDMIATFDTIVQDSILRDIPIFSNPLMKSFCQKYNNELAQPETYEKLNKYLDDQRNFDVEYQTGVSAVLPDGERVSLIGNDIVVVKNDHIFMQLINLD